MTSKGYKGKLLAGIIQYGEILKREYTYQTVNLTFPAYCAQIVEGGWLILNSRGRLLSGAGGFASCVLFDTSAFALSTRSVRTMTRVLVGLSKNLIKRSVEFSRRHVVCFYNHNGSYRCR